MTTRLARRPWPRRGPGTRSGDTRGRKQAPPGKAHGCHRQARPAGRSCPRPVPAHLRPAPPGRRVPTAPPRSGGPGRSTEPLLSTPQTGCTNEDPRPTLQTVPEGQGRGSQQTNAALQQRPGGRGDRVTPQGSTLLESAVQTPWGSVSSSGKRGGWTARSRPRLPWPPQPSTPGDPAHLRWGSWRCRVSFLAILSHRQSPQGALSVSKPSTRSPGPDGSRSSSPVRS